MDNQHGVEKIAGKVRAILLRRIPLDPEAATEISNEIARQVLQDLRGVSEVLEQARTLIARASERAEALGVDQKPVRTAKGGIPRTPETREKMRQARTLYHARKKRDAGEKLSQEQIDCLKEAGEPTTSQKPKKRKPARKR